MSDMDSDSDHSSVNDISSCVDSDLSSVTKISALQEVRGHIFVEWTIKNFFDLPNDQDRYIDSPSFFLSDGEWYIIFLQKDCRGKNNGYMSMFLCLDYYTSPSYKASFTLGIKKSDGSVLVSRSANHNFDRKHHLWGWYRFYKRSKLMNLRDVFAADGSLTVFCGIYLNANEKAVQTPILNGVETLSQNFQDLLDSETEGDVTFKVNEEKFVAHKVVLSARSTVFKTMFNTDISAKNTGIVEIKDSDPSSFKDFLNYIYSGKLHAVSSTNARALYSLAKKYDFQELKIACSECMVEEISADSVCEVVYSANLHDEQELKEAAIQYFIKHANAVFTTPKWFSFFTEHPALAHDLLLRMANSNMNRTEIHTGESRAKMLFIISLLFIILIFLTTTISTTLYHTVHIY